ncbi:unnamed protein product, partial [Rhizoctonia solani]
MLRILSTVMADVSTKEPDKLLKVPTKPTLPGKATSHLSEHSFTVFFPFPSEYLADLHSQASLRDSAWMEALYYPWLEQYR